MLMVFDMLVAVAEAAALPAISEFRLWVRKIGDPAGCAAMEGFLFC